VAAIGGREWPNFGQCHIGNTDRSRLATSTFQLARLEVGDSGAIYAHVDRAIPIRAQRHAGSAPTWTFT